VDGHDHGPGKWGIAGLGIAGGLVPSPSALIVLLGAMALGRTVFGVLLVIAYGLGMAATLTAAGLLLVRLRDRLEGRLRFVARWRAVAPPATAALIVLVGLGLAGRALTAIT
jgi:ABC-type nickel/cobalt efflux system permease component RcnA